jgi:hypothetical protein
VAESVLWFVERKSLGWTPTLDHWEELGRVWAMSHEEAVGIASARWNVPAYALRVTLDSPTT